MRGGVRVRRFTPNFFPLHHVGAPHPLPLAQEVAKHNTDADCWIIIHNKVYDVTKFLHDHPGGPESILEFKGRDATAACVARRARRVSRVGRSLACPPPLTPLSHTAPALRMRATPPLRAR